MKALGAKLIGVRQAPWDSSQASVLDELFTQRVQWPQLYEAVGKADLIVLTCAVTDATRGMVNEAFVGACKEGVVIINIARGGPSLQQALLGLHLKSYARRRTWRITYTSDPADVCM